MKTSLPNRSQVSWLVIVLGCVIFLAAGQPIRRAEAQDYFRVSPGALSAAHAEHDNSQGCDKCHISSKGVDGSKCTACHGAVRRAGSLHTTFGKPCVSCHREHQGRSHSLVNWSTIGGRDGFQHDRTGFRLENQHAKIACTKCHTSRLRSGGTSYAGRSRNCQSCHKGAHGFSNRKLSTNCGKCHAPGQRIRGRRLRTWKTSHRQYSGLALGGKHLDVQCTQCHPAAEMAGRKPPRACSDCHVPSHPISKATNQCLDCHSESAPFKGITVDHSDFGFDLVGRHAKAGCAKCHQRGGAPVQVSRACSSCHTASHPRTRATANCAKCHSPLRSFKGAKINHGQYGLALHGKHKQISCSACHMNKQKTRQLKLSYTEGACTSCHTHSRAHAGQYGDQDCDRCHVEGGKRDKPFDHNVDCTFPLHGFHAQAKLRKECESCHPGGVYRNGKTACRDCHDDTHDGSFGTDCSKCHSPLVQFSSPRTHNVNHSAFPLEGKHKIIACRQCHIGGKYDLASSRCVDCHKKDDVHQGRLGQDCGKCHRPTKGAPKFRHKTMTQFPLRGAHRSVRCAFCHQSRKKPSRPRTLAEWRALEPPPLDRQFPAPERDCAACHADPHEGRAAGTCANCHTAQSFTKLTGARARSVVPANHRGAWLKRHSTWPRSRGELGGEKLNCATCHGAPDCSGCHRTSAPRSHGGLWRLRMHGSAASFDASSCRVCHQVGSCKECHRRTRPLNHRGAWSVLHGFAAGGFGGSNCYVCHTRTDCLGCHTSP